MNRRAFLASLPAALVSAPVLAYSPLTYAPRTWREVRETRERVILNFRATWSLTCQMKRDTLVKVLADEPRYNELTFIDVDWDTFAHAQWTERLKVERRSTLVAMRNGEEVARLVADPSEQAIRGFLDTALTA
jgi:thioredoxin-like negative regulator of GroEL